MTTIYLVGTPLNSWHCKTSNQRNWWFSKGTLAIAAIKEKYLNKEFTSGLMKTRRGFKSSRVDVRAAFPIGKWLRSIIYLSPMAKIGYWPSDGEIALVVHEQGQTIINNMIGESTKRINLTQYYRTNQSLNEFHTYSVQWDDTYIEWMFDGIKTFEVNLTDVLAPYKPYNPFTKEFRLGMSVIVGGEFFDPASDEYDLEDGVQEWNCSLLLIDYARVYSWVENGSNNLETNSQNKTEWSSDLCQDVMSKIKSERKLRKIKPIFQLLHLLVSVTLILVFILLVCLLYLRYKKSNKIKTNEYNIYDTFDADCYYDNVKTEEVYDQIQDSNGNAYVRECASENEQDYVTMTIKVEVDEGEHIS